MMEILFQRLTDYRNEKKLSSKGELATVLHVSRLAKEKGLPLNPETLVTEGKGQVLGLGKARVQSILKEYGITKVLAEEGGRTSRKSLNNMYDYVAFLNGLHQDGIADLSKIESWWVERILEYFAAQPLVLKFDASKSFQTVVADLIQQAFKRQKDNPGTQYVGAMLQHLVGAKLALIMGDDRIEHHGFSVADAVSGRAGDFTIDNVIIHVTTSPGEALIQKCIRNIQSGYRPVIVTLYKSLAAAFSIADMYEMQGRIDIFDIEQFIATNVYEWSKFKTAEQKVTITSLIDKYNELIGTYETDPSLKVAFG